MSNMENIAKHLKGTFRENYSLRNYTWFKVGGNAQYYYSPYNTAELIYFLKNKPTELPITLLGAGSNVLITSKGIAGVVIHLNNLNFIENVEINSLRVEAGCTNTMVAKFAKKNNIGGLEFLSGIPGTVGGGIFMNAGAFGTEFKDIIVSVKALSLQGKIINFTNKEMKFSYRHNGLNKQYIFLSCIISGYEDSMFNIQNKMDVIKLEREENQPKKVLTGGSTFANPSYNKEDILKRGLVKHLYTQDSYPQKAWQLLDAVGLRGFAIGGAKFSQKHCNFIINENKASSDDIENLISEAYFRVKKAFGIDLKTEIQILK